MSRPRIHGPRRSARHWFIWLALGLAWTLAVADAAVAPPLPFVAPGGLLQTDLRLSEVEARLGPAPVAREQMLLGEPGVYGQIVFEYPLLGLGFVVPPVERPQRDPRIAFLLVKAPAGACTPEGLCIGMPWKEAKQRLTVGGYVSHGDRVDWEGSPGAGDRKAIIRIDRDGRVESMAFDAGIPHVPASQRWWATARQWMAYALLLAYVLLLPWLIKVYRRRVLREIAVLAPMRAWLGKAMLWLSPMLVAVGVALLGAGGPVALLGVVVLVAGAGLLLPAVYNLVLGAPLTPARLGGLVVLLVVVLALLALAR